MSRKSSEMHSLARAIAIAGGQKALADKLGTNPTNVWNWLHREKKIPAEQVLPIWRETGKVVSPHSMRPDIYPVIILKKGVA